MKTLEEVLIGFQAQTLDGRDANRLADFMPEDQLESIGVKLKEEFVGQHKHLEWTEENILKQLKKDVEFGFQKALDQRGISASLMYEVVGMWNDILENGINKDSYSMYGLPRFKATAVHYGWNNPIGDDNGDEDHYNEEYYS